MNLMCKGLSWTIPGTDQSVSSWGVCVQPSLYCRQFDLSLYPVWPACLHPASLLLTAHTNTRTSYPHTQATASVPGPWPLLVGTRDSAQGPKTPPYSSDHTGHPHLPSSPAGPHSLSYISSSSGKQVPPLNEHWSEALPHTPGQGIWACRVYG